MAEDNDLIPSAPVADGGTENTKRITYLEFARVLYCNNDIGACEKLTCHLTQEQKDRLYLMVLGKYVTLLTKAFM